MSKYYYKEFAKSIYNILRIISYLYFRKSFQKTSRNTSDVFLKVFRKISGNILKNLENFGKQFRKIWRSFSNNFGKFKEIFPEDTIDVQHSMHAIIYLDLFFFILRYLQFINILKKSDLNIISSLI